jgi:hypothetical protein
MRSLVAATARGVFLMAYVSAFARRAGESSFGGCWRRAANILDCMIPLALVVVLIGGCAAMAFGLIN